MLGAAHLPLCVVEWEEMLETEAFVVSDAAIRMAVTHGHPTLETRADFVARNDLLGLTRARRPVRLAYEPPRVIRTPQVP